MHTDTYTHLYCYRSHLAKEEGTPSLSELRQILWTNRKPVTPVNRVWPNLYIGDEWVENALSILNYCKNKSVSMWCVRVQVCGTGQNHTLISGCNTHTECCSRSTPHQHRSAVLQWPWSGLLRCWSCRPSRVWPPSLLQTCSTVYRQCSEEKWSVCNNDTM